jgi:23S rRNA (guanosine2251-2'-O)-methyltransferase
MDPRSGRKEIIFGRQSVWEALRAGRRRVHAVFLSQTGRPAPELDRIRKEASRARVTVNAIDPRRLDTVTDGGHHQGAAAEVGAYPYVDLADIREQVRSATGRQPLILLLDHIQDPQNLGAILRSADAAGVDAVLVPADRAAGVTPATVRASSGASEHVQVALVTNLAGAMRALKEDGLWMAGLEACDDAGDYTKADLTGPLGLVIGSEGDGLGRLIRETCDLLIKLPMHGKVNSLNASAATAVALYEVMRQRSLKPGRA